MKIQLESAHLVIFESCLYRTTTTLVLGDDHLLLVDPNWLPAEIDFIAQYIDQKISQRKPYLLFTHSDYDHIIGYGKFQHYDTIASSNFKFTRNVKSILGQISDFDIQYYIARNYPIEYPDIKISIDKDVQKSIGSENFHFYQAPGHNPDGLITFLELSGVLIVGDYLSNLEFPFIEHSFVFYRQTLDKLEQIFDKHQVTILITGHGDHTTDVDEMRHRLQVARFYLDSLEAMVLSNRLFDLDYLRSQYPFFAGMEEYHQKNIDLVVRELSGTVL
jgi:glyoxylase-like metal-dependent hydrolase (beta-lactamase superfamily II)